jgi:uridine phosphorylase
MFTAKGFMKYNEKQGRAPKIRPPKGIIICYSTSLMDYIKKNYKVKEQDAFGGKLLTLDNIGILGNLGIGAPSAAVALEEAIALGTKRYINLGTAGTLSKKLSTGDIVVCDRAIRDEGTSHHYIKTGKYSYPSKEMTENIIEKLSENGYTFDVGTSWTIDAPYRETIAEAKHYQKEGVLTVEMEASALFTVAKYHDVQIGSIFVVSDSLAEMEWKPNFHRKEVKKKVQKMLDIAMEVLKK